MKNDLIKLNKAAKQLREQIIKISYQKNKGHISSALSIVDILIVLYWEILNFNPNNFNSKSRDYFILSKGHSALALYIVLNQKKIISTKQLNTYGENGTLLGVHPEKEVSGVEASTGSLGHGLGIGVGIALGTKSKVYVLISDAECQEGSVWESAMFAASHQISNLYVIIDYNKVQAFGKTNNVTNLEPLTEKWTSFGWNSITIDGHNIKDLYSTFTTRQNNNKPTVFICNTTAGKGISFMENQIKWHYLNLTKSDYEKALKEIKNS